MVDSQVPEDVTDLPRPKIAPVSNLLQKCLELVKKPSVLTKIFLFIIFDLINNGKFFY
jgi:hypothetical protein